MVVWQRFAPRDNLPRIGYTMPAATATASSAAAGFGAALAINGNTYDAWKPTALPAWLQVEFAAPEAVDYIGVGAHTLDVVGATIKPQWWDGSAWVDFADCEIAPANDRALFWLLNPVTTTRVRVYITGGLPEIAVLMAGKVTRFDKDRFADYLGTVMGDGRLVQYKDNYSVSGNLLGSTRKNDGVSHTLKVDHISEAWAALFWQGLLEHCLDRKGLFVADRPGQYPEQVLLAHCEDMPTLERTLPNKVASRTLQMNLRGYKRNAP